jgi:Tetratricopeptide repeat
MPDLKLRRNSFQQVLIKLEYEADLDRPADLFSRACVQHYREFSLDSYGYSFTQVFEPGVLKEVALLEGRPYAPLADLSDRPGPAIARLAELAENAADLPVVGLVNVASALITISRFGPASRVLKLAEARPATPRERLEIALLNFMVSNRRDDGAGSPEAFRRMREAIETGQAPHERALDVCSQAVVWYLKRKEVSEDDFRWYVAVGCALAKNPGRIDSGTISAWNRAVAMIPAGRGQAPETRHYMQRAREAAEEAISRRPRPHEMNFIKTYYESTIKEHLYVTGDFEKAKEAGNALIALDPGWGPSYGELAEVYQKSGDEQRAAELYEQAAALGPPYVGHHLLRAVRCREALGDYGRAVDHCLTLSELAPRNESLLTAGLRIAEKASRHARDQFESLLAQAGGREPA